ncbi:MAG: peptidase C39 family protein, partial [Oleibacter sp.]|nr:peptidase C39 family protein [Thalassolituus sp.]
MTVREASIRKATVADLQNLVLLENACFTSDRLTSRRFRHFIKNEQSELWLSTSNTTGSDQVNAYALMLFHRGTSLARLYSIAVSPDCRGQGLAQALLEKVEERAIKHGVMFIRLEVKQDNERALDIYQLAGYQKLRVLREYYEDGADGWRLEKRLRPSVSSPQNLPFYAQTTPFTCGPSALLMA